MFRLILAVALLASAGEARASVAEGLAWLHSFEYERALAEFERAEQADPRDALAYWGQAMCYQQLLWGNENVDEARAILARMRQRRALASAPAKTRAWLATLEPLFGAGDRPTRLAAYAAAMREMAAEYPEDPDVAAFHGLAVMATRLRGLAGQHGSAHAESGQLAGSDEQRQAAEIFSKILTAHPKHPGALHYLIHAWDDPEHAHRALDAARVYSTVVPESSHARHMPAHVFFHLGMWEEAIAADEAAAAAADARVAAAGLPVTATDFHPLSWLVYEYLQTGRADEARRTLDRLRTAAQSSGDPRLLSLLGSLRGRVAVETEDWQALPGPDFVNYDELFAVGFSAARRDDLGLAERARIRLGEMARQPRYADRRPVLEIMALQVGAAIRSANDDLDGALALLADATQAERALPHAIGPPALIKPAQEQYGDALRAAGRFEEARTAYAGALERAPGRRLSREGREQAAAADARPRLPAWTIGGGLLTAVIAFLAIWRRRARSA